MAPVDPIVGLNEIFQKDDFPSKVIVGVGSYRDEVGKPYVLPCVREAEKIMMGQELDMEYTGIAGEPKFVDLALKFAYGDDSVPILENRVQGVQSLSGTGGLRVFGELMRKHGHKHIYVPNPTWGNHIPIFTNAGLEVRKYRYYDSENSDLDFSGLMDDIKSMPEGSIVLLHACAHNPTGMDPTMEQWKEMSDTIKKQNLHPFFRLCVPRICFWRPCKGCRSCAHVCRRRPSHLYGAKLLQKLWIVWTENRSFVCCGQRRGRGQARSFSNENRHPSDVF